MNIQTQKNILLGSAIGLFAASGILFCKSYKEYRKEQEIRAVLRTVIMKAAQEADI